MTDPHAIAAAIGAALQKGDILDVLEREALRITDSSTMDEVAEIKNRIDHCVARARDLSKVLEEALCQWITWNGPITIGEVTYYVGPRTSTKCTDKVGVLKALWDRLEDGDDDEIVKLDDVAEYLSSQPWKHGACHGPLGETWGDYFEKTMTDKLESGETEKVLKRFDSSHQAKGK